MRGTRKRMTCKIEVGIPKVILKEKLKVKGLSPKV